MADSTLWWIFAGLAVAVELLTGTFYLLMLAFGLTAGALAAQSGASLSTQLIIAALVGGGAVVAWHFVRGRQPAEPRASTNRDVNLDIGETVQVHAWNDDGTAIVHYRGAKWTVVAPPGGSPEAGTHVVREVVGSRLLVEKEKN